MFEQERNANWKGGICNIRHVDELVRFPEYCDKLRDKIDRLTLTSDKGCWQWEGIVDKRDRRAVIKVGTRRWTVARVLMFLLHGEIGELQACHSCDNPICVNPDHIWLGTCKDNQVDKWRKGRAVIKLGEDSAVSKLTEAGVREIRSMKMDGVAVTDIASKFKVCVAAVYKVLNGKTWKHVK